MSVRSRIVVAALTLSATGFVGILTREDIRTEAYPDPVHGWDVPSIGAGSTEGVKRGDKVTPLAAVQRTAREVRQFEGTLKACIGDVELYQEEYDAYVQLAHNIGGHRFCFNEAGGPAVIPRALAKRDYRGACDAILQYNRAGPVNKPSDRCSHPDNRTCRGLWADRLRLHELCTSVQ